MFFFCVYHKCRPDLRSFVFFFLYFDSNQQLFVFYYISFFVLLLWCKAMSRIFPADLLLTVCYLHYLLLWVYCARGNSLEQRAAISLHLVGCTQRCWKLWRQRFPSVRVRFCFFSSPLISLLFFSSCSDSVFPCFLISFLFWLLFFTFFILIYLPPPFCIFTAVSHLCVASRPLQRFTQVTAVKVS